MFSSYSLSAAFDTSEAACDTPAFVCAAAELPFEAPASSMADATWLVTASVLMEVSLLAVLSLVEEGRDGIVTKCLVESGIEHGISCRGNNQ